MTRRLVLAALVAGAMLVTACGDDDTATTTAATATTVATQAGSEGSYPDTFTEGYMEGCTSEAPEEACQCTLDEFEKRYSLDEFMAFGSDPEDPRVIEVIEFCLTNG